MTLHAVPSLIAAILLPVVGALALAVNRRSREAWWFAAFSVLVAMTCGFAMYVFNLGPGEHDRALLWGRLVFGIAATSMVAMAMQLRAISLATGGAAARRLAGIGWAFAVFSLIHAAAAVGSHQVIDRAVWRSDLHYWFPIFGRGQWGLLGTGSSYAVWAAALLINAFRQARGLRRAEILWTGVGAIGIGWFGMIVFAGFLPLFGIATLSYAPLAPALGSCVVLAAMVLTRQRELEQRMFTPRPSSRGSDRVGAPDQGCRACSVCGGVLAANVAIAHCPLDGGAISVGTDPWPGSTIDERFTIEKLIGAGGMGRVYLARHLRLGERVALKMLFGDLAADKRMAERFLREARSAMRVRSPHVVVVYDLGEVGPGIPFLTMEYIEGSSLAELLAGAEKLSPPAVALLGAHVAEGLSVAHDQGVIHRDLKPDNVLVSQRGDHDVVKIVDFGLAKIVGEDLAGSLTTAGTLLGTLAFISPEQARGGAADGKSDIYSLGVMLYRARAGRLPFSGAPLELLGKHLGEQPPPLGSEPIDEAIPSLMAKDPAARPTARALAAALRSLYGQTRQLGVRKGAPVAMEPTLPHKLG